MNAPLLASLALTVVFAAGFVWAWGERGRERRRGDEMSDRLNRASAELAAAVERARNFEDAQTAMAELVRAQAAKSAEAVAEQLVKRAEETFQGQERQLQAKLEGQLKPVAETLAKFEQKVDAIEKARAEESGGLKEQIGALLQASTATQAEARKLSAALRRGAGVQGRWGEQTLRNVLETAGLASRFDFEEQFSVETEEGRRRPDVKVRMPGGGVFVIDAKASLNAYLEAQDAPDDASRDGALLRHAQSLKAHVQGLSQKAYWDQFKDEGSPDFVAMFVPGDGFLAAALERSPDLLNDAMAQRVLIVTPTTLFALCKAVAYGWRVEDQARNARDVADLGRELYKRLSVMGGHVQGVGNALTSAANAYNKLVGSLESQVLTQARRFEELRVDHEGKQLKELEPVEIATRALGKLSADEAPALTVVAGKDA